MLSTSSALWLALKCCDKNCPLSLIGLTFASRNPGAKTLFMKQCQQLKSQKSKTPKTSAKNRVKCELTKWKSRNNGEKRLCSPLCYHLKC